MMEPPREIIPITTPPEDRMCQDYESAYLDMVDLYVVVAARLLRLQGYARRASGTDRGAD